MKVSFMPFLDRFWWLRLLLGGVLLIAAPLFALWYLDVIAPIDLGHGPFGVANAILAAETVLILVYAGFVFLWRALRAGNRRVRRLDALTGNRDAIPLARQAQETSAPPDSATLPWQVTYPASDMFFSLFFRAIMLIFLLCLAGFLVSFVVKYTQSLVSLNGPLILFGAKSPTTAPGLFPVAFFALVPLFLALVPQDSPASVWDRQPGRCASLVADDEGVRWCGRSGHESSIRWSDIRLFEVMNTSALAQVNTPATTWRISILYSGEQPVWWRERVSADGEMGSERCANLERLIETKTTLQPRTFDPLLMPTAQRPQRKRNQVGRWTVMLIASVLPILTVAEARDIKVSLALVAVLGASAVFLFILNRRKLTPSPTEGMRIKASVDGPETESDSVDHIHEMRTSARWYERARALGIVIGAGVSLAFAAWLLYGVFEFKGPTVRHIVDLLSDIAIADLFGGFAALFTIGLMRSRPTIVRASADSIIQDGPIHSTLVPWNGVVAIERDEQVNPPSYRVEADVGSSVTWPLQTPKSLEFTPSEGASLATPEQFTEIVMARSGVPITTRVRGK